MFKTALLIVTQPLKHVRGQIPLYLSEINRLVSKTVYIHIQPETENRVPDHVSKYKLQGIPFTSEIRNIVNEFYSSSANVCSNLDIRILLGNFTNAHNEMQKYKLKNVCELIMVDTHLDDKAKEEFITSVGEQFSVKPDVIFQSVSLNTSTDNDSENTEDGNMDEVEENEVTERKLDTLPTSPAQILQHRHTIMGGTFDRLHTGHKLLLSEGCLLATKSLTVGVTDGEINAKKTLCELIQPVQTRLDIVRDFLDDVKPSLEYKLVPITDMFGPTITEPDLDLIVLSQEVKKGGEIINTERQKKGMRRLEEYTIDLVEDSCHSQFEDEKVSSSSLRKRLLGTLYQPLKAGVSRSVRPYIIGLTGGIASGKSSVCKRLEGLGAVSVDCDKLGHKAYVKGTRGFDKVVQAFGVEIVGADGEVDRKILGPKVFANKNELSKLNQIVWPEIAQLAKDQIQEWANAGHSVIVLEAALLLEASWDVMTHEVWTTIVPPAEAIRRMVERNNLTEEQAKMRLDSQISNTERVHKSNVILSTLWEYKYTQLQVEKAWAHLMQRIGGQEKVKKSSNI